MATESTARETTRARLPAWAAAAGLAVFLAAVAAETVAIEAPTYAPQSWTAWVVRAALVVTGVAWVAAAVGGRAVLASFEAHELAVLGVLCAVRFALSFVSRIVGVGLTVALGPYAIFVLGLVDEGLACALLAVAVVLAPRIGTAGVLLLSVFLLNALLTASLGASSLVFITLSVVAFEGALALVGLSWGRGLAAPGRAAPWGVIARMALALGAANAVKLAAQYALYRAVFNLHLADEYVLAVVLVVGGGYGALGAACGAVWGYRLRSVAP